jgi:hypothetical protein
VPSKIALAPRTEWSRREGRIRDTSFVIHTDETFLEAAKVEQWLIGATFPADRITDVLLGLSYDPCQRCCPMFKLRVCRSDQRP